MNETPTGLGSSNGIEGAALRHQVSSRRQRRGHVQGVLQRPRVRWRALPAGTDQQQGGARRPAEGRLQPDLEVAARKLRVDPSRLAIRMCRDYARYGGAEAPQCSPHRGILGESALLRGLNPDVQGIDNEVQLALDRADPRVDGRDIRLEVGPHRLDLGPHRLDLDPHVPEPGRHEPSRAPHRNQDRLSHTDPFVQGIHTLQGS